MKSSYEHISDAWKKPKAMLRLKTLKWRSQDTIKKIENPTRLNRARALGYRAKQGFILVRVRIQKGGRHRPKPHKGRKPSKSGRVRYTPKMPLQAIVERRAASKYPNLEVLNSYYVGEDGTDVFYEIILVDPAHPVIKSDKKISWIIGQRRRAFRGLTRAGRSGRSL